MQILFISLLKLISYKQIKSTPPSKSIHGLIHTPSKGRNAINRVRPRMAIKPVGSLTPLRGWSGVRASALEFSRTGRPQDAGLAVTPYTAGVRGFTNAPAECLRQEADLPPPRDGVLSHTVASAKLLHIIVTDKQFTEHFPSGRSLLPYFRRHCPRQPPTDAWRNIGPADSAD